MRRLFPDGISGLLRKLVGFLQEVVKNGDSLVFLLFLALTFFFWISKKMSESFLMNVDYRIELTGIDDDIRVVTPVTSPVRVTISGQGAALWAERRKDRVINVNADRFACSSSGRHVMSSQMLRDSLSVMLPSSLTIGDIHPDTIRFSSVKVKNVTLPVKFAGGITDDDRYSAERIYISPERVMASVDVDVADTVFYVYTEPAVIDVHSDTTEVRLKLMPGPGVVVGEDAVTVGVVSSQYTEKSVEVPVSVRNMPAGMMLRVFPSKVKVMFLVSLTDFDNVKARDFRVAVDYRSIDKSTDRVEPVLVDSPMGVRNVKIQPQVLNYLLESVNLDD